MILVRILTLFSILSLIASESFAFLPSLRTILTRTAKNNGKGAYLIDQDVIFQSVPGSPTFRERWTIVNGQNMRVSISAASENRASDHFDIVYFDNRRASRDHETGKILNTAISPEFFESFSHTRTLQGYADALIKAQIVDAREFRPMPIPKNPQGFRYEAQPYVSLARQMGTINWYIGRPSPAEPSTPLPPSLWIEQDAFLLRKLRFNMGGSGPLEVNYDLVSNFPGGLKLAKERRINWGMNSAIIRVVSVRHTSEKVAVQQIDPKSLRGSGQGYFPNDSTVREFYSRFR